MSRPSKLTQELQQKVVSQIRRGIYPEVAALAAGISAKTFKRWMARGAVATRGSYHAFYEAVHRAESHAEIETTLRVRKAAKQSPMTSLKLLERRFSERWSPYRKLQAATEVGGAQHGIVVVTAEQLRALLAPASPESAGASAGASEGAPAEGSSRERVDVPERRS
jgi:hypothetical protein